mmetsp:Transcript_18096/g.41956  ORF Transcript_18096/g.41956 Transcript_18096/m.41956 type:complete len:211 (+) Transcript_18096:1660-2292(+)
MALEDGGSPSSTFEVKIISFTGSLMGFGLSFSMVTFRFAFKSSIAFCAPPIIPTPPGKKTFQNASLAAMDPEASPVAAAFKAASKFGSAAACAEISIFTRSRPSKKKLAASENFVPPASFRKYVAWVSPARAFRKAKHIERTPSASDAELSDTRLESRPAIFGCFSNWATQAPKAPNAPLPPPKTGAGIPPLAWLATAAILAATSAGSMR